MAEDKHYVLGGWADEDLYRKVKAISERDDRTISWLVCKALADLVERDEARAQQAAPFLAAVRRDA
jgi:predicted transcriptional regulator